MLDTLYKYSEDWGLNGNVMKTKIVIFRNGGKILETGKWMYNAQYLEVVNSFKYLGMLFTFKHVAELRRKTPF
jgi:hypothetical protein